ncbi:hypothetical protein ACTFIW_007400 [Dictyostelium discoideum]
MNEEVDTLQTKRRRFSMVDVNYVSESENSDNYESDASDYSSDNNSDYSDSEKRKKKRVVNNNNNNTKKTTTTTVTNTKQSSTQSLKSNNKKSSTSSNNKKSSPTKKKKQSKKVEDDEEDEDEDEEDEDEEDDEDEFNLPNVSVEQRKKKQKQQEQESSKLLEETEKLLKQPSVIPWTSKNVLNNGTSKDDKKNVDTKLLFSFSSRQPNGTNGITSPPSQRLASIKKPFGGGEIKNDYFSKFLYTGPSTVTSVSSSLSSKPTLQAPIKPTTTTTDTTNTTTTATPKSPKSPSIKSLPTTTTTTTTSTTTTTPTTPKIDSSTSTPSIEDGEDDLCGIEMEEFKDKKKKVENDKITKDILGQVDKLLKKETKKVLVDDSDTEDDEEEEEEEVLFVNKKRKSNPLDGSSSTPTKPKSKPKPKKIIIEDDDDSETEDEKSQIIEIDDKEEEKQVEQVEQVEEVEEVEEEEEEEIESEPTIERLIYACECFSKRMLQILSNAEDSTINTTTAATTTTTTTKTTIISNKKDKKNNNDDDPTFSHKLVAQPKIINKVMRNYQLIGLNWMAVLYKEKINGILADEMGLGKTVQTISLLAHIKEAYNDNGPHLVVVPATILANWEREFQTWCPSLSIVRYYGNLREREELRYELKKKKPGKDFNVILTTYNLLFANNDRGFLKRFDYSFLILDEAQNIKNSDSKRYKNIFKIGAHHRLLLTGTPLQNNLYELWSLLNFLMPHIFGSVKKDNYLLNQLLEYNGDDCDSAITRMKKILSPFILRRLKSTVSKELKPKIEHVEICKLPQFQDETYKNIIERSKSQWRLRNELLLKKEKEEKEKEKQSLINSNSNIKRKRKTSIINIEKDEIIEIDGDSNGGGLIDLTKTNDEKDMELSINLKSNGSGQFVLNNILMQLRKAANHPLLCKNIFYNDNQIRDIVNHLATKDKDWSDYRNDIPSLKELFDTYSDYDVFKTVCEHEDLGDKYWIPDEQFIETSTKCLKLKEILAKEIGVNKSKVLIFSQMTRVLDILEDVLDIFGYNFTRLDGSTPVNERQSIIDHFSSKETIPVFLLSTNSGGLGINLTCANVVVFYDLSFNPQVDRQAEDRAHRLGQEREVIIYKLLAENTVDINIHESANQKKKLNDNVLEEGTFNNAETKLQSKNILKILDSIFK